MQVQTSESTFRFEVVEDKNHPGEWRAEAIDIKAGDVFVVVFCGPSAKDRAEEYAKIKNAQ